jgi:hypothetical protein
MTRKISVQIETDPSGELCYVGCRFWVGNWCDAFNVQLSRLPSSSKFLRCEKCKKSEVETDA